MNAGKMCFYLENQDLFKDLEKNTHLLFGFRRLDLLDGFPPAGRPLGSAQTEVNQHSQRLGGTKPLHLAIKTAPGNGGTIEHLPGSNQRRLPVSRQINMHTSAFALM